jgi:phenylalanyl-tRNA synthetase beta subunit
MHPCDIAEDIAIAYDYDNLEEKPTPSPTIGS